MATTGKKGGSKMYWIIGGLVVVAGGIGIYFLLKNRKKQKDNKTTSEGNNKNTEVNTSSTPASNVSLSNYKLDTTAKVKAFQDWMDAQGKGWINKNGKWVLLNKGAGYGNFGSNTQRVWNIFGKDYLKTLN